MYSMEQFDHIRYRCCGYIRHSFLVLVVVVEEECNDIHKCTPYNSLVNEYLFKLKRCECCILDETYLHFFLIESI